MLLIAVFQPILDGLKRVWPFWNLEICILVSLSLQVILLVLAPWRKWAKRNVIYIIVWVAYLISDWIATIATGIIFKNQGFMASDVAQTKIGRNDFMPMWASFLLLHLGGPDTITSYAIADNQLWLRHLTSLLFQVFSTAYIIYLAFPADKMRIPMVAVFVAGTIKYSERTRALFLASLDRFGRSVLSKPDPGPNYEDAVNIYSSTSKVDVPETKEEPPTKEDTPTESAAGKASEESGQSEIKLIQIAHRFFDSFKGLIVGYLLSSKVRRSSRRYLRTRTAKQAFRLVAYELGFIYDVLHTKVVVVRTWSGYALRVICVISLLVALFEFRSIEGQYRAHFEYQVRISYTLFFGALGVEVVNVLMFICSDWTLLESRWSTLYPLVILKRQRWSMSFSRYDMISYCLNRPPEWLWKLAEFAHLTELLDKINTLRYSYPYQVEDQLQKFIFQQLNRKATDAETLQAGFDVCKQKGDGPLQEERYKHLQWSIEEYQYAESLLLWHIATEIRYQTHADKEKASEPSSEGELMPEETSKKICKQISDYMFSLLLLEPTLMTSVLGNWQTAFQDTRAEARRFFEGKFPGVKFVGDPKERTKRACEETIKVKTPCRPAAVKGSKSKSVFFDAVMLAKQLKNVPDQWNLMGKVWMELMSYAAINCTSNEHAQQPSTGGELLTFVWLLMNHFGLGTQFYEHEVGTRTKMIHLLE